MGWDVMGWAGMGWDEMARVGSRREGGKLRREL